MTGHEIIVRPIVTEKTMAQMPSKTYTFEVHKNANKIQVAIAVEEVFGGEKNKNKIKVSKVRTAHVRGKFRRQGRNQGYTRSWKKAVVTLTEDSKGIEFFEGMV